MKNIIFKAGLLFTMFWLNGHSAKCQKLTDLPKVIPPSPVASTFNIYGDYPVSHNTGVPDIQIPLYIFKNGDIELPIVLKYHIGAAKPNPYHVEMSNIGYGWVLDAGGLVSRTVMGKQDELGKLPTSSLNRDFNQMSQNDYDFLRNLSVNSTDSEYDIFNYNFLNTNGKFVIEKNQSGSFDAITFPYKPYKFSVSTNTSGPQTLISSVSLRDDYGFDYIFSDVESNEYLNSGWYLSQINSPTNRQVNILYNNRSIHVLHGNPSYYYNVNDYFQGYRTDLVSLPNQPDISPSGVNNTYLSCETKTIKEINSDIGKVVFTLTTDNSLITSFIVYNASGQQIKKIIFYQSKFPNQTVDIKLDSLLILDSNSSKVQKYIFQYNANSVLNSQNVDYWGYYNGNTSSAHLPFTEFYYYFANTGWSGNYSELRNLGNDDRCVNPTQIMAQTLSKIIYPTGGSTEFVFEPNVYNASRTCSYNSYGAGLRIKSIINKDISGAILTTKTYEYQPGLLRFNRFDPTYYRHYSYSISSYCGQHTTSPPSLGFTITRSTTYSDNLNSELLDNYIRYASVTEYFGDSQSNLGKNVYSYTYDNNHDYKSISFLYDNSVVMDRYKDWGNGLLRTVETSRKEANNTYTPVKEINYHYRFFNTESLFNLKVFRLASYPSEASCAPYSYSGELDVRNAIINNSYPLPTPPFFGVYNYYIQTGGYLPTETTETFFLPQTVTTSTKNYYEKGDKKYVTKTVFNESTNQSYIKRFTYPYDYSANDYLLMTSLNRINHIIELTEEKNSSIQKTKTSYKNWGSGILAPDLIQTAKNSQSYENRVLFSGYDNRGNILDVAKESDMHSCYLWGYNKAYPVSKIENATLDQVKVVLGGSIPDLGNGGLSDTQKTALRSISNAMVTTYTYTPLIGMTSQTDPNGVTTYYEYDTFGRLKCIKDDDGHILKTFEYHYKQ